MEYGKSHSRIAIGGIVILSLIIASVSAVKIYVAVPFRVLATEFYLAVVTMSFSMFLLIIVVVGFVLCVLEAYLMGKFHSDRK